MAVNVLLAFRLQMYSLEIVNYIIYFLCAAITVQFEHDMYMVRESDGMVDVTVVASGRTSFAYTFTVTPMDLTATSKLHGVRVMSIATINLAITPYYELPLQTHLTTFSQPPNMNLFQLMAMNQSPHLSYQFPSLIMSFTSLTKTSN